MLAAYEGDRELGQALEGAAAGERPAVPAPEPVEVPRTYLSAVEVDGFRGIGPAAVLRLQPGPGLTLVVGRNGSGKSSFAEAAEVALTGTNARWIGRNAVWKTGWRNLHDGDAPCVAVELAVDGQPGATRVVRSWPGDDVDATDAWFQRPGAPRRPAEQLGWGEALTAYRPFLSYSGGEHEGRGLGERQGRDERVGRGDGAGRAGASPQQGCVPALPLVDVTELAAAQQLVHRMIAPVVPCECLDEHDDRHLCRPEPAVPQLLKARPLLRQGRDSTSVQDEGRHPARLACEVSRSWPRRRWRFSAQALADAASSALIGPSSASRRARWASRAASLSRRSSASSSAAVATPDTFRPASRARARTSSGMLTFVRATCRAYVRETEVRGRQPAPRARPGVSRSHQSSSSSHQPRSSSSRTARSDTGSRRASGSPLVSAPGGLLRHMTFDTGASRPRRPVRYSPGRSPNRCSRRRSCARSRPIAYSSSCPLGPCHVTSSTSWRRAHSSSRRSSFFVLSGTVRLYDSRTWTDATAGDLLYVPVGGVHAFRNESGQRAEMLLMFAPGAPREAYVEAVVEQAASGRQLSDEERVELLRQHDQYEAEPAPPYSSRSVARSSMATWALPGRRGADDLRTRRRARPGAVLAVAGLVAWGSWAGIRDMQLDACLAQGGMRDDPVLEPCDGLTDSEAEAHAARQGYVVRVLGEDGQCLDATADERSDRVNVVVEDGRVVRTKVF